jgi:hypothetical protein
MILRRASALSGLSPGIILKASPKPPVTHPDSAPSPLYIELSSGLRMPYVEAGDGELLLFVHGSLCDYRYWQPQLAGMAKQYRCVAVSLTHYWPQTDTPVDMPFRATLIKSTDCAPQAL